jgi:uncharacterized protein DUF3857
MATLIVLASLPRAYFSVSFAHFVSNSRSPPPGTCRYNRFVIRLLPLIVTLSLLGAVHSQEPSKSPAPRQEAPPQIEITLLETKVRFESNGDSRKEVHCVVKINSEVGVRQFARLNFDYNRAFQQIEIPFVRVTHSSGGTADILPGAITDNPNPAVVNYPAYHDVRVKSVRILGLAPSDTLEYRVITTTTRHPLAPDFWLDHSFDRSGIVSHEVFTLDLPAAPFEAKELKTSTATESDPLRIVPPLAEQAGRLHIPGMQRSAKPGQIHVSPTAPEKSKKRIMEDGIARLTYVWDLGRRDWEEPHTKDHAAEPEESDVVVSTFGSWSDLALAMGGSSTISRSTADLERLREAAHITYGPDPAKAIYEFISKKITTVDLPFGDVYTGPSRNAFDTLSSGYGTPYAKTILFEELGAIFRFRTQRLFFLSASSPEKELPRPTVFSRLLIQVDDGDRHTFFDPSVEVAPFGLIGATLRGRTAFRLRRCAYDANCWTTLSSDPPFASSQRVQVTAVIAASGELTAKVNYTMRGDNELLLRVAFHQSPREKWNEVAQLLSLSDGFRGKIEKVSASDPYATKDPFTVEYEISQPKFVDWSKKPVRIPAVLPLVGLPDPPADPKSAIELGTPLDVETSVTLHLPPGTTVESPAGTTVDRDYATFSSTYSATGNNIAASRHIHFLLRELPAHRAADYSAFVRAIQSDQSQLFRLTRPDDPPPAKSTPSPRP